MDREIVTRVIDSATVRAELERALHDWPDQQKCFVLFGWHWGNEFYPGERWYDLVLEKHQVIAELNSAEARGIGKLAQDDFFISNEAKTIEYQFCHESDIHFSYRAPLPFADLLFERWLAAGLAPTEREIAPDSKQGQLLRVGSAQQ